MIRKNLDEIEASGEWVALPRMMPGDESVVESLLRAADIEYFRQGIVGLTGGIQIRAEDLPAARELLADMEIRTPHGTKERLLI